MTSVFLPTRRILLAVGLLAFALPGPALAAAVSPDDTARFIAGLPPAPDSSLAVLARKPAWQSHARWFDDAWTKVERERLSKIRDWSAKNLKGRQDTLFYMFSGPDFVYANAFFPKASTYLMSGLEPVGRIPVVAEKTLGSLSGLHSSLYTSLNLSFFITAHMRNDLRERELGGTLPILLAYLARSGKTVQDIKLVGLDKDGNLKPEGELGRAQTADGVKIVFVSAKDAPPQTLYYFRTDVSDSGVANSGFLKFADGLGSGDGLLKSASYLMHNSNFSKVREFVLQRANAVVQDDSGIPAVAFKADDWELNPFGKYVGPIAVFPGAYQARLNELFKKGKPPSLDFGLGYRHRGYDSNLVLAVKKTAKVEAKADVKAEAKAETKQ